MAVPLGPFFFRAGGDRCVAGVPAACPPAAANRRPLFGSRLPCDAAGQTPRSFAWQTKLSLGLCGKVH